MIVYNQFVKQFDAAFLLSLSELFINLSAGWFGATFIVPVQNIHVKMQTANALLGKLGPK